MARNRLPPVRKSDMLYRFQQHYTIEQARALLPMIREWLSEIHQLRRRLQQLDTRITQIVGTSADAGGESVNTQVKLICDLQHVFQEFQSREIQIKEVDRGLIDFPAIIGGKEVFLCWEQDETDIEFWHDLDTGYAGRERL
jgi:hypothetical protein